RDAVSRRHAADSIKRLVQPGARRLVIDADRKGKRVSCGRIGRDELLWFPLLVEVALQTKTLQPRAAIREERDDVGVLDAHRLLRRLADKRGRSGSRGSGHCY